MINSGHLKVLGFRSDSKTGHLNKKNKKNLLLRLGCKSFWMGMLTCSDAPLAGKRAVLVGLDGPLKGILQGLLQNEGVEVQASRWSADRLQKQVVCDDYIHD